MESERWKWQKAQVKQQKDFSKRFFLKPYKRMERKGRWKFILKNNNGTFCFCGWELKVKVREEVFGEGKREINSKASFIALHITLFAAKLYKNLNSFLVREKLLKKKKGIVQKRTNINFAFESVILTFHCLFICHILEAFSRWKGFFFLLLPFVRYQVNLSFFSARE